jgi:hypothetical protein
MARQHIGYHSTALFEAANKVSRLANRRSCGLSKHALELREQIEVPMNQIIAPKHKKDRAT